MDDTARQQNEQQPEVPAKPLDRMTGDEARDFLYAGVRHALEECAVEAEEMAARLTASGKDDQAMVALQLAAKIRSHKPPEQPKPAPQVAEIASALEKVLPVEPLTESGE